MRTTLDISDDVLFAAQQLAQHTCKPVGQVIDELLRQALGHANSSVEADAAPYATLPSRGAVVTNEWIEQLREQEGI